jgi:phage terminase large subunit-like protein
MTQRFKLTQKQNAANQLLGTDAKHIMLFGGSRSGKTFILVRAVCLRAIKAPKSRHAILRFRFNAVKNSVVLDTFPKVMELCFPDIPYTINKSDWYAEMNGSQIWFSGLDDKERTEKILGMEFVTLYFNESSQIPYNSVETALTRLAQKVEQSTGKELKPKSYYDCNPPNQGHWTYKVFKLKVNPETREPLINGDNYVSMQINPTDNQENLTGDYIESLKSLSARSRRRFLDGEFADANPNALFSETDIDKWRVLDGELPDMVRIVVSVDPSGAGDNDNADNDAIGIVVAGIGTNGFAYIIEDLTVKAGPKTWGTVAVNAYERHRADCIVGETNFGGEMVNYVIQTVSKRIPFKSVSASRGKVQRAEPFSALYEQGKVRHVGYHRELEDELLGFSTSGYIGDRSPNRADAAIWALAELFPSIVKGEATQTYDFTKSAAMGARGLI